MLKNISLLVFFILFIFSYAKANDDGMALDYSFTERPDRHG